MDFILKEVIKSTECDLPIKHFYSGTKSILHMYHLTGKVVCFWCRNIIKHMTVLPVSLLSKTGLKETIIMVALCFGLIYSIRNSSLLSCKEENMHVFKSFTTTGLDIMETRDRDIASGPKRYFYLYNLLNERSWQSNWLHQLSFSHHIIWHNQEVLQQQLRPRAFACQGQVLLRYRYYPLKQKATQVLTWHTLPHICDTGGIPSLTVFTPHFVHNFLAYNFFLLLKKTLYFGNVLKMLHIFKRTNKPELRFNFLDYH